MSWTFDQIVFAEPELKGFQGRQGLGFYKLFAQIFIRTLTTKEGKDISVFNIGGELSVIGNDNNCYELGHMLHLGTDFPIETRQESSSSSLELELELDLRRLEGIELIRSGKNLNFNLKIYGMALRKHDMQFRPVYDVLHYNANQSSWIEILDQMGYQEIMLLEIPLLSDEISPCFLQATENLETAHEFLRKGHFSDSLLAHVEKSLNLLL